MVILAGVDPPVPKETAEDLYENAPCGYLSALPGGRILRANKTFLDMIGRDATSVLDSRFDELLTVPGRIFYDTHFRPLLRIRGYAKEIACDLVRGDGSHLPVLMNAVQISDAESKPLVIRYTVFEATERRRFETELVDARRRIEHLASIVQASSDSIFSMSPDGIVRTWNPSAERTFGYAAAEAIGNPITDLITDADGSAIFTTEILSCGEPVNLICELKVRRFSQRVSVSLNITPHVEPPNEITGVSVILRDITEARASAIRQRNEDMLKRLVGALEEERHRIALDLHDQIGQQVTAIRLALTAVERDRTNDPELLLKLTAIADMALEMDHDISELSFELSPRALDKHDLVDALRRLLSEWSSRHGVETDFDATGPDERLAPDIENNLYRITQEALNNAAKHAGASHVAVILTINRGVASLIIEDNGRGFDPQVQATRSGGGGFGLGGMEDRATLLGGEIEIESAAGSGTTIYIKVPARFDS